MRGPVTQKTIVIAGGGTAGHVMPGIAVMQRWRGLDPAARLVFLGSKHGFEQDILARWGWELRQLPSTPFARERVWGKALAGVNLLRATAAARSVLRDLGADLVLGLGGYAALPAVIAARTLRLPAALHEANILPGLGNRLAAPFSNRIFLGWQATTERFGGAKAVVSGNPVLEEIQAASKSAKPHAEAPRRITVVGGSEGSPHLNAEAPAFLAEVQRQVGPIEVRHLAGRGDARAIARRYESLQVQAETVEAVGDPVEIYRNADFVIATAGAITLAELAWWGLPALLAPLAGAARDHQRANAEAFVRATGALLDWSPVAVANILLDAERYGRVARQTRAMAAPEAADIIVQSCLELL